MSEPRSAEQRLVRLEIETHCVRCGGTVPIDGLVLRAMCACKTPVELGRPTWQELLTGIDRVSFDQNLAESETRVAEASSPVGKLTARWRANLLACDGCGARLALVEPGMQGAVTCTGCGKGLESFPAPLWVRAELLTAMQLYGAARDDEHGSGRSAHHFWLSFQGTPPALLDQHQQTIESAIGPPPPSSTVTVISRKRAVRWEYIGILVGLALMGAAVHRCGRQLDDPPVEEVEPSQ